jgi:osmotically-inducible protein OsmY
MGRKDGGVRDDDRHGSVLGIAVTAVAAFALGAVAGMALGGAGAVQPRRVKETIGRIGRRHAPPSSETLEQAVLAALREDEATSDLDLHVQAVEPGLLELTGVVTDATVRRIAGDIARAVPGVDVVVNRIMTRRGPAPAARPARPV